MTSYDIKELAISTKHRSTSILQHVTGWQLVMHPAHLSPSLVTTLNSNYQVGTERCHPVTGEAWRVTRWCSRENCRLKMSNFIKLTWNSWESGQRLGPDLWNNPRVTRWTIWWQLWSCTGAVVAIVKCDGWNACTVGVTSQHPIELAILTEYAIYKNVKLEKISNFHQGACTSTQEMYQVHEHSMAQALAWGEESGDNCKAKQLHLWKLELTRMTSGY